MILVYCQLLGIVGALFQYAPSSYPDSSRTNDYDIVCETQYANNIITYYIASQIPIPICCRGLFD